MLTRVAASHIRVGTMQWAAAHQDHDALRALADYTLARHYPELADAPEPHLALFDAIIERQARLIARWQLVGFIHGVMNTDNMALSGETIDYGPCAFMDAYDPATVFSSIDHGGRYAYGNQPPIAQWNLARLAEAMLPLFDADTDRGGRAGHRGARPLPGAVRAALARRHAREARTVHAPKTDDKALVDDLLAWMQRQSADFTNTFRSLTDAACRSRAPRTPIRNRGLASAGWRRAAPGSRSPPPKRRPDAAAQSRRSSRAITRSRRRSRRRPARRLHGDASAARRAGHALRSRPRPAGCSARPARTPGLTARSAGHRIAFLTSPRAA